MRALVVGASGAAVANERARGGWSGREDMAGGAYRQRNLHAFEAMLTVTGKVDLVLENENRNEARGLMRNAGKLLQGLNHIRMAHIAAPRQSNWVSHAADRSGNCN